MKLVSKWFLFQSVITFLVMSFILNDIALAQKASKKGGTRTAKFGAIFQNYSGEKTKSISNGSPGYGGEITVDDGGAFFRYFLRARAVTSEGKTEFNDGGTTTMSSYKLSEMSPEIGISIYPVRRGDRGLNLYVWGAGIVSYNFLELDPISSTSGSTTTVVNTFTKLKDKDQGYAYGGGGGLGFELMFGSGRGGSKFLIYGELGFREQIAQLANMTNFQINSVSFSLGFGF